MEWLQNEDYYEEYEKERRPRDTKIDEAKEEIVLLLEENPRSIYFVKQVQVLLERKYFHWIVGFAIAELIAEGEIGAEEVPLSSGKVKFIFHARHRRRKLQVKRAVRVIEAYLRPEISLACGQQAENLFLMGLMEYGFLFQGRNTRAYGGREWTITAHTLDFIVARDGVVYGAEVKNTWDYIGREELELKMRICAFLGMRPLFIWRYAPKNYMNDLFEAGGYGMIFVCHIFPMGQEQLVADIKETFGLPCDTPRRIPDGIVKRLVGWHERKLRARI